MSRFVNKDTGVVFSVDDSKDDRYSVGFDPAPESKPASKTEAPKAEASKSSSTK